ncbi:hypothetical protein ACFCYN_04560 [Gottfriedia sp. NPDC056225]|uniref:hypothetical protein n=1 Tax=Gottfriedia sp. NPDC056225 TaxID=3345751 RepID=UPI0035D71B3C
MKDYRLSFETLKIELEKVMDENENVIVEILLRVMEYLDVFKGINEYFVKTKEGIVVFPYEYVINQYDFENDTVISPSTCYLLWEKTESAKKLIKDYQDLMVIFHS